jgi:4'-phosphopantetheinyl transferase
MKIYAVKTLDISEENMQKLCLLIADENRQRIARFFHKQDKIRTLIGEILIRKIITEQLGIRNDEIVFAKNSYGKPYLQNCRQFYFNISHSEDFMACAIDNQPVGIDVEQVKHIDDYRRIAERYFTESELAYITKTGCDNLGRFYEIWTAKESYIKCRGKGLSIPLKSFSIEINRGNIQAILDDEQNQFLFKQLAVDTGYKITVCSLGGDIPDDPIMIRQNSLLPTCSVM